MILYNLGRVISLHRYGYVSTSERVCHSASFVYYFSFLFHSLFFLSFFHLRVTRFFPHLSWQLVSLLTARSNSRAHQLNLAALTHFSLLHIPSHAQLCPGPFTSQVRIIVCQCCIVVCSKPLLQYVIVFSLSNIT